MADENKELTEKNSSESQGVDGTTSVEEWTFIETVDVEGSETEQNNKIDLSKDTDGEDKTDGNQVPEEKTQIVEEVKEVEEEKECAKESNVNSCETSTLGDEWAYSSIASRVEDLDDKQDDSDDISVISESDTEQLLVNNDFNFKEDEPEIPAQPWSFFNAVTTACTILVLTIGIVVYYYNVNSARINEEIIQNNRLEEIRELRSIVEQFKTSIPELVSMKQEFLKRNHPKIDHMKESRDAININPDTPVHKELHTMLNTIYSLNEQNRHPTEMPMDRAILPTLEVISDVINYTEILSTVIQKLDNNKRTEEMLYLQNTENKIKDLHETMLTNWASVLHKLVNKVHLALSNIRQKLNTKLCLIRQRYPKYDEFFKSLEDNGTFVLSCEVDRTNSVNQVPSIETPLETQNETDVDVKQENYLSFLNFMAEFRKFKLSQDASEEPIAEKEEEGTDEPLSEVPEEQDKDSPWLFDSYSANLKKPNSNNNRKFNKKQENNNRRSEERTVKKIKGSFEKKGKNSFKNAKPKKSSNTNNNNNNNKYEGDALATDELSKSELKKSRVTRDRKPPEAKYKPGKKKLTGRSKSPPRFKNGEREGTTIDENKEQFRVDDDIIDSTWQFKRSDFREQERDRSGDYNENWYNNRARFREKARKFSEEVFKATVPHKDLYKKVMKSISKIGDFLTW